MKRLNILSALVLMALALFLNAANVSAQLPSPAPKPIPRASGTQGETNQNKDSAEKSPSTFDSLQSAEQRKAPSATDTPDNRTEKYESRIAIGAVAQAVCAVLLVIFTGLLACYGYRGWKAAVDAAAAAGRQADAAARQAEILEKTLAATQRARIKVRRFQATRQPAANNLIDVQFQVVNTGETDGEVIESNCTIYLTPRPYYRPPGGQPFPQLPMPPPYDAWGDDKYLPPKSILKAGLAQPVVLQSREPLTAQQASNFFSNNLSLFVLGYILYKDKVGLPHKTAFCRFCDRRQGPELRFVAVDDPDYEHEE